MVGLWLVLVLQRSSHFMQLRRLDSDVADVSLSVNGHTEADIVWCGCSSHFSDFDFEADEKAYVVELIVRCDQITDVV